MVFVFERLSLFGEQSELEENNDPTTLSVMIEIFKDHKEILLESFGSVKNYLFFCTKI